MTREQEKLRIEGKWRTEEVSDKTPGWYSLITRDQKKRRIEEAPDKALD